MSLNFGDIRNLHIVNEAMDGVDIVIKATALKQVTTYEYYPKEVVRTNMIGIEYVVNMTKNHRIEVLVSIGTDMAVKPVNVMGITKAKQERILLAGNRID